MRVISLSTDIGTLKLCITTLLAYNRPITRSEIEHVVSRSSSHVHCVIVREDRILYLRQLVYPAYLAVRNHKSGQVLARKVELEVLCYMACTASIRRAIDELLPQDCTARLLVMSFCFDCDDEVLLREHMRLVNLLCENRLTDLIVGFSCLRFAYTLPEECREATTELDYMETIVKLLAERFS